MIVQFKPREVRSGNRVEALVKGEIEVYDCNKCGEEFEVLFNDFPEKCPYCNTIIDWENSEK